MPLRLKSRFYKTVLELIRFYRSKYRVMDNKTEQTASLTEIRMLRRICGVTRDDRIKKN